MEENGVYMDFSELKDIYKLFINAQRLINEAIDAKNNCSNCSDGACDSNGLFEILINRELSKTAFIFYELWIGFDSGNGITNSSFFKTDFNEEEQSLLLDFDNHMKKNGKDLFEKWNKELKK